MIEGLYKCFEHWGQRGGVWVISDTHFGEDDLKAVFSARPSDEQLLKQINSKVGKAGVLIHLGDVGDLEYARRLKGYKILIMGNHDQSATKFEGIFNEIYQGPLMIGERLLLSHEPVDIDWAFCLHGHTHNLYARRPNHLCACVDVCGYTPINFNEFMKSGLLKEATPLHRYTIDKATERKKLKNK